MATVITKEDLINALKSSGSSQTQTLQTTSSSSVTSTIETILKFLENPLVQQILTNLLSKFGLIGNQEKGLMNVQNQVSNQSLALDGEKVYNMVLNAIDQMVKLGYGDLKLSEIRKLMVEQKSMVIGVINANIQKLNQG